jgi:hypothetical protein
MVPPVNSFEMPKGESELLKVQRRQLFVRTMQGVRDRMRQGLFGKIALKIEDVLSLGLNLPMLRFGKAPDQEMDLAFVIGKIGSHLLAKDHSRQMRDFEAPGHRVVIRNGDKLHPDLLQAPINLKRIRVTRGKLQSPEDPVRSAGAMPGVDVEIGCRLRGVHCSERERASQSS